MSIRAVTNTTGSRSIGNKAAGLDWLANNGALVPTTWIVKDGEAAKALLLDKNSKFAVRSSAADEDTETSAAAGAYLTELEVPADEVAHSVERVRQFAGDQNEMTVIVQEMVDPVVSGVAFSRNPVTGLSDIVVEAIEGRGDALLQDGADPMRWTYRNDEFVNTPQIETPHLALIEQVVAETQRLADEFGPADLEWVWDGSQLYIVQIRPITTISDVPIYSRRIAKDVMPGMIKPLVWSVNVPMVNSAWVRLFTEAIGPNDLDPEALAKSFAYRSYFDMRAIGDIFELMGMPRDALENLLGLPGAKGRMRPGAKTFLKLPRMLPVALKLQRAHRWVGMERQSLQEQLNRFDGLETAGLTDDELTTAISDLTELCKEAAYLNIVAPLLANAHASRFDKALEKEGFDSHPISLSTTGTYDPGPNIRALGQSLMELPRQSRESAASGRLESLGGKARKQLDRTLEEFGYLSENANDLSTPRWRDDPTIVLKLALASVTESTDPSTERPFHTDLPSSLARKRRKAQTYEQLRDSTGATFAYGYGLLRPLYLELGDRLVRNGAIPNPEHVFYVDHPTAAQALVKPTDLSERVQGVIEEMEAVEDLLMPDLIVGDEWLPQSDNVAERLVGVGASKGRHRGTARFVSSLSDADLLDDGEVLVVEYSDVAWTPLFGRAGAVVTAAGGMLAHSSITAREMGIPCVASVANARLLDGSQVLVDGYTGEVFVESEKE